jgi:hypothetical protein
MSTNLKMLPFLAKIVLVAGLFCGVISSQCGFAQSADAACVMAEKSAANAAAAPMVGCQHCCAGMPCCLTSRPEKNTPPHPEPVGNESTYQLGHAPCVATFTLVSSFDSLPLPQEAMIRVRVKAALAAHARAPRGAVSCIWLI